jgi:glycosyltransferase involved in cell wall biosynthesis
MKDKKFLIAVVYYERPKVFLNALNSILNCNYDNFEVHVIDDGSINKAEPIAREVCASIIDKFKFTYINNSIEEKKRQGGSIHGKYLTEAIRQSSSDHVIVLCDDDAIYPNFLKNLNNFLNLPDNINKNYFYHNIVLYDSLKENYIDGVRNNNLTHFTNKHTEPINCNCAVDGSQVTFDREKFVNDDIFYAYPQTKSLDADSFQKMFSKWGPAYYSGLISQVKSWNNDNLGARSGEHDFITKDMI